MTASSGGAGSVAVSAAFEPDTSDEATLGNITGPVINYGPGVNSVFLNAAGIAVLILFAVAIFYMTRK
jgi:hypothetical protein